MKGKTSSMLIYGAQALESSYLRLDRRKNRFITQIITQDRTIQGTYCRLSEYVITLKRHG